VYVSFMIDPRLRVLQLVAQHGTVTAAAEALRYAPSAVSHQLRQLSSDLKVQLLVPDGRRVRLTEHARVLLRHAEILFAQAERAYADLESDQASGQFTLCGFSTFPGLDVRVIEAEPARCTNLLLTGEADLALLTATTDIPAVTDHRFDQRRLLDDPLDLVVPRDHPLAHRSRVTLADASAESWIVGRPDGATIR
jgi:DNA-binding transcriptional LysR family regulator